MPVARIGRGPGGAGQGFQHRQHLRPALRVAQHVQRLLRLLRRDGGCCGRNLRQGARRGEDRSEAGQGQHQPSQEL